MRARSGWWAIVCAVGLLLVATDVGASAPAFPAVITTTVPSADSDLPIPDNGSLVTVLTSDVAGQVIDVDLHVDITHTSADNLDIFLVSPSGITVTMTTDNGGANDDVFADTTFDDQAMGTPSAPNVRNFTFTNLLATGPIQPEGAMGAFVGEPAAGPWALVVIDDTNGSTGMLHNWSLTFTTLSSLPPPAPVATFDGPGGNIPDNNATGFASTIDVSGLGTHLMDVDVTVSITHNRGGDIDLFLTSPSGRRIDLVTDIGGNNVDLYKGTTFDDSAPLTIGDATIPTSPAPFTAVVPEGALGAFIGEDPNGTWTLTVVDDTGGVTGKLDSWQLHITTPAACGDGVVGPGEACDDGNGTDGDGCDHNCTVSACGNGIVGPPAEECDDGNTADGDGCSSVCRLPEAVCDDCQDNDGNGRADAADPGCAEGAMSLHRSNASTKGTLTMRGDVPMPDGIGGPVSVVFGDGNGPIVCAGLGDAVKKGKKLIASGTVGNGKVTVAVRGGLVTVKGRGLDLSALDDANVNVGVSIGGHRFAGGGVFRTRGSKRLYP